MIYYTGAAEYIKPLSWLYMPSCLYQSGGITTSVTA